MAKPLTPKRRRFVAEYLIDLNATQAAIRAGYSPRTANEQGAQLLTVPAIAAAVAAGAKKATDKLELTAERILEELMRIGYADMGDYIKLDPDGTPLLDWSNLPDGATKVIQEIVQEERYTKMGERVLKTRFKIHPKLPALDLLGKRLALWINRHEHTGKDGERLQQSIVINGREITF